MHDLVVNQAHRAAVKRRVSRFAAVRDLRDELRSVATMKNGKPWFDCLWSETHQCLMVVRRQKNGEWEEVRPLKHHNGTPRQLMRVDIEDVRHAINKARWDNQLVWARGVEETVYLRAADGALITKAIPGEHKWLPRWYVRELERRWSREAKTEVTDEENARRAALDWWNVCKGNFSMVMP